MTDCDLYSTEIINANSIIQHDECAMEWERRFADNKCVRCGKKNTTSSYALCNTCNFNSTYDNYPGGSV